MTTRRRLWVYASNEKHQHTFTANQKQCKDKLLDQEGKLVVMFAVTYSHAKLGPMTFSRLRSVVGHAQADR